MRSLGSWFKTVFSGLRFRLFVLLVLACAPLVALMLHTSGEDRRKAKESWRRQVRSLSQIAKREEQDVADSTRQLLLAISESGSLRSLKQPQAKRSLDDLYRTYKRYANFGLLSTNGELIASVFPLATTNWSSERFFVRALERRTFSVGTFPKASAQTEGLYFGHPVLDPASQPLAVVFAELDLVQFARASEIPSHLPAGATWMQLDQDGTVMSRYPRPELFIGRSVADPLLMTNALMSKSGEFEANDPKGVRNFYAFSRVRSRFLNAEAISVLASPPPMLFAEADQTLERSLTWLGIAAVVTLTVASLGSRFLIIKPINALVNFSGKLAAGDLSVRTGLKPSDHELGKLTQAFDTMAQALQEREAERELANKKLQVLSNRLVEVQESERRQIARELHDEIGQSLTAAEMNLQSALTSADPDQQRKRIRSSIQAVECVQEQVHDLTLNLRPSMLDDLGLEPTLRAYTHRQAELTGISAEFHCSGISERLHPLVETECFRVAQEALTNIVRHSKARSISVDVSRQNGHLHLCVRDDGIGFDVEALRKKAVQGDSLGLLSMEERAVLAGGGLQLSSAPGRGTEVHAWFPLRPVQTE